MLYVSFVSFLIQLSLVVFRFIRNDRFQANAISMKIVFQGKSKTGKDILVRYPQASDAKEMLEFINTLSDERTFIRYQGEHETLESETTFLKGRLDAIENKKAVHLLAFCEEKLIGGTDIHMLDKTERHIGVFGLVVHKNYRSFGVGEILMNLVLEEAKKELPNLKLVTLHVYEPNIIAQNLYKKMGFKEYGMLPEGVYRRGTFENAILMYKKV